MDNLVGKILIPLVMAFLWVLIGRLVPLRPTPASLRDKTRLALSYVDDRFTALTILETLIFFDLTLIAFGLNGPERISVGLFGRELPVGYLSFLTVFLLAHGLLYAAFLAICRSLFVGVLNCLTEVVNVHGNIIPEHLVLDNDQWTHYSELLERCLRRGARAVLDGAATFVFLLTISIYMAAFSVV